MKDPIRGELWWGEHPDLGRRPYLVITRNAAIPVLSALLCVPVTRTVRGIPTELPLGPEEGLSHESVAGFDNMRLLPKSLLVERIGRLAPETMREACRALRIAVDC